MTIKRYYIGKVGISAVTMDDAIRLLENQARLGTSTYVCVANIRVVVICQKDEELCRIQNNSFLTLPDGMPLVWFARLEGIDYVERVTGPDIMTEVLQLSDSKGYTHYLLGDTEETLAKIKTVVRDRFRGVKIVGALSTPFRPLIETDISSIADEINQLRPTFVWIALGAPKQERVMAKLFPRVDGSILIGVGAAFRFLLGEYKHPPKLFQLCGLEGVFWRFRKNPLREAWWYCRHIPWVGYFLLLALCMRIGKKTNV